VQIEQHISKKKLIHLSLKILDEDNIILTYVVTLFKTCGTTPALAPS